MGDDEYDQDFDESLADFLEYAEPGGNSALRAATPDNPRDRPCPSCGWPDRLTRKDVALGYQCDKCADALERGGDIDYYEE